MMQLRIVPSTSELGKGTSSQSNWRGGGLSVGSGQSGRTNFSAVFCSSGIIAALVANALL